MNKKLPLQQSKFEVLKAVRAAIRLKHSIEADREINDVLPEIETDFDTAMAKSKTYKFDLSEWVKL